MTAPPELPLAVRTGARALGILLGTAVLVSAALLLAAAGARGNAGFLGMILVVTLPSALIAGVALGKTQAENLLYALRWESGGSPKRARARARAVGGAWAATVAAAGMAWGAACLLRPPTDAMLRAHFERHRPALDRMVAMAGEDTRLLAVSEEATDPAEPEGYGVSAERVAAYRRLLREVGLPKGFFVREDRSGIDFPHWEFGSGFTSVTIKGIAYSPEPPERYIPPPRSGTREAFVSFRPLRDHWYIYDYYLPR
mgnify:CR=1 FL=1|jgi:hypothetical protein